MAQWGAVVLAMGLVACGGGIAAEDDEPAVTDPDNPDPQNTQCAPLPWSSDDTVFEVGGGSSCFASLPSGAEVSLIAGPQGGYHLWLGMRCRGCERHEIAEYGVRDPETGDFLWGASQSGSMIFERSGDYRQLAGLVAYVPGDEWNEEPGTGTDLVGQDLALFAEVTLDGVAYTSEVVVHVGSVAYQESSCPECN